LCGVFYFAAALSFLRWATATTRPPAREDAPRSGSPPHGSSAWYVLSLVLFLAALLSKTVACTLPAALLLVLWWKRGRVALRDLLFVTPLLLLGLAFGLLTAGMEQYRVWGARRGMEPLAPGAHPAGRAGHLLLCGQAAVAASAGLHLPALAHRHHRVDAVRVSGARLG